MSVSTSGGGGGGGADDLNIVRSISHYPNIQNPRNLQPTRALLEVKISPPWYDLAHWTQETHRHHHRRR